MNFKAKTVLGVVLAAGLIGAAPASATPRFAAPTPVGAADCSSAADACSIETAVNSAVSGDDVTLLAGPYTTSTMLHAVSGVTVHGTTGAAPLVSSSAIYGFEIDAGSALRDVKIDETGIGGAFFVFGTGSMIERVSAQSSTANTTCQAGRDSLVRDTICWQTGGSSPAAALLAYNNSVTGTETLRNVTAVSTVAAGILVQSTGGTNDVVATGVIAKGTVDVGRQALPGGGAASLVFDHSNYASESDPSSEVTDPGTGTGNVSSPAPVFVDATNGDFHETSASAGTIDLGSAAAGLGAFDFEGGARSQGAAPDIGADEFNPPSTPPTTGGGGGSTGGGATTSPTGTAPVVTTKKCKKKKKKTGRSAVAAKKCKKKK